MQYKLLKGTSSEFTVGIMSAIHYSLLRLQKANPFCSQIDPADVLIFLLRQKRSYKPNSNCQALLEHFWHSKSN